MKKVKQPMPEIVSEEPQRRLSPWRVMLGILILCGATYAGYIFAQQWVEARVLGLQKPWFAAYVDATATPLYTFEQLGATPTHNVMLSFIVSSPTDACTPTWGGAYTLNQARGGIDLDRRIARLRQLGGNVGVSFGGLLNDELAVGCKDHKKLLKAYESVIDRYAIDTIDLDLEGLGLTDKDALKRRASVIAELQKKRRAAGKSLAVWLTLPVATFGLTEDGTNAVAAMLAAKVDIAGVNAMTMNYGESKEKNETLAHASIRALKETHRQLGILYKNAGINLNTASVWKKIGATPMIGQNDIADEVFTLKDAEELNKFATSQKIGRMSMWSANRDVLCGDNYVSTKIVSDSCSGVREAALSFANTLSKGFKGELKQNAAVVTTEDPESTVQQADDPANSPYQIWTPRGAYLEGTKVVWHRNVYQAKWWTQGDLPDNPVLNSWQTPWQLIGPVLPGEKPIPQPTLPAGTYPEWSGEATYNVNQRILFNGVPYQAKWWSKGESPAAATSDPDNSPWVPLTQKQIEELLLGNQVRPTASTSATPAPSARPDSIGTKVTPSR